MSVEIKLIAEDWMMTAGLIGLTRLYKNHPQPPVITQTGLILTEEHLLVFSKYYIEWLISEFSIVKRDVGRMDWAKEQVEHIINIENMEPEKIADHTKKVQDAAKSIRTIVVEQMKKVEKYFLDTDEYEQLKQLEAHLEKINKDEQAWAQAKAVKQSVADYQRIMSIPYVRIAIFANLGKARKKHEYR
ncbi:hypothetical protein [Paenibacillus campi]|uniref:hypothetical protein n=1 Tax=Paenibacillus campi TaxID=3106031 RepID=UPI002AFFD174|nr:hypothetical protein [Paenibacillus sp. SGZ-1014]